MNIRNFCAELNNNPFRDNRTHFYVPNLNLEIEYGHAFLGKEDMTTFYDKDTGEELITVPSNLKEISTWDKWEKKLKISQHSPVYRIIKSIFDGMIIVSKDPEDEYGVKYVEFIPGYEL